MKRALVSVYDKTGLVEFVKRLVAAGYEIVSSGGTAATLRDAGIDVMSVEQLTGAPEILGGRVKTLHPKVHGGILARGAEDDADLAANEIVRFDLVVCNLYPFRETVASGAGELEIIEKIDIGGPTMVRAAAKNHRHVGVVVSPDQYDEVAAAVESGGLGADLRRQLATEAFFHTAAYDAAIVGWIGDDRVLPLRHTRELRYGENPHQPASLYRMEGTTAWWAGARQIHGKEMSFNNYVDADAAWRLASDLGEGAVTVIKHTNAAGAARGGGSLADVFQRAWDGDSLAAFGGVVGVNATLDGPTARALAQRFVEVVVAADVSPDAADLLSARKDLRVLVAPRPETSGVEYRSIDGGFLAQQRDEIELDGWEVVSKRAPGEAERAALAFAWIVCAHTKSNAIVIARGEQAVGVGAGDQSRVGAAERAVAKAGERAAGAVAASDAFFPFRDGLDTLAAAGVTAVVEPGGSRNDREVIDAADEHGMALLFTSERHFRH